MAQDNLKFNIPPLNGGNYVFWKTKVRAILVRDDLWDVVSTPKPEQVDDAWIRRNNKAMACITLSVEDNQLIHFAHFDNAYDVWQALSRKYERSTFGSRLYLRRKLYSIHYCSGSMANHVDSIMEVVGLLRGSGKPLEDEKVVAVLLVSLPESYSGLLTALEGRQEADLTIEYVTGKILDEYQRRMENTESSEKNQEMALQSAVLNKGNTNQRTNSNKNEKDRRVGNKVNKEMRTCFFCNKPGHIKADCISYKRQQQLKSVNAESGKTSAKLGVQSGQISFSVREEARSIRNGRWYIDSGATSHMTSESSFFTILQDTSTIIYLADGSSVKATGIGEGRIACKISESHTQIIELTNVLYIPQLDGGLLSVQRMTENGFRVVFKKNTGTIYLGQRVVTRAQQEGSLFRLTTAEERISARVAGAAECIHKWHRRLGHRDPIAIKRLVNEELAMGIKLNSCSDKKICEHCIKGKLTQAKFPESKRREKAPMRLIHSDLCGPMQSATPSGN